MNNPLRGAVHTSFFLSVSSRPHPQRLTPKTFKRILIWVTIKKNKKRHTGLFLFLNDGIIQHRHGHQQAVRTVSYLAAAAAAAASSAEPTQGTIIQFELDEVIWLVPSHPPLYVMFSSPLTWCGHTCRGILPPPAPLCCSSVKELFAAPPSPPHPTTLLTPQMQRVAVCTGSPFIFRLVQRCIIWNREPKFGSQLTAKVSDRSRFLFSTALFVQLQNARLCSSRAKSSLLRYIKRFGWRQSKMQSCSCSVLQDARHWTNV